MHSSLKKIFFHLANTIKFPSLLRETFQKRRITIVTYHNIKPLLLEKHLVFLKQYYNIITLKQYITAYENSNISSLPLKSLIITLDDGFKSNYKLASIFKKHNVIPTIFLTSGLINTRRHFWWTHCSEEDREKFKTIPDKHKLKLLLLKNYSNKKEYSVRQALSKFEINQMQDTTDFQSHTVFHPILPMCTDKIANYEIKNSKIYLDREFGLDIYALAYPNGDYSDRDILFTKNAGYKCGLTIDVGFNSQHSDLYRLKRICIPDDAEIHELPSRVSGLWDYIKITLSGKLP